VLAGRIRFFKWIKQHLRIKTFYGTNERGGSRRKSDFPAVCTALTAPKRLHLPNSLMKLINLESLTMFETTPNKSTKCHMTPTNIQNLSPKFLIWKR
jgi:hypothetical protein